MTQNSLKNFLDFFATSMQSNTFIKITLSHKRDKNTNLNNVFGKVVKVKNELKISFVYRYPTNDITKNFDFLTATRLVEEMLRTDFFQADIFTATENRFLIINSKGEVKMNRKTVALAEVPAYSHDNSKKRYISPQNNIYLNELGITTADGKIKNSMEDKYRQINKYIEIIDTIIHSAALPENFSVVDMGSGKGYLTFALYDYLVNSLKLQAHITGVEFREELVEKTNLIAHKAGFGKLHFKTGSIQDTVVKKMDMLIALHACDTATDEAIYSGIQHRAAIIICAPCCHKQIRKQMNPDNVLKHIIKYGILAERQAELLTDALRAMLLEAYGYKTKVFEFISSEHTPKNVLIVGIKRKQSIIPDENIIQQIAELKKLYNIESHFLETLLHKKISS